MIKNKRDLALYFFSHFILFVVVFDSSSFYFLYIMSNIMPEQPNMAITYLDIMTDLLRTVLKMVYKDDINSYEVMIVHINHLNRLGHGEYITQREINKSIADFNRLIEIEKGKQANKTPSKSIEMICKDGQN